jgi:hypothetical protein
MNPDRMITLDLRLASNDSAKSLSAVAAVDDLLWLASDETRAVLLMNAINQQSFGFIGEFDLDDASLSLDLPGDPDDEIDIEGMDLGGGYLWVIGSHSSSRDRIRVDDTELEAIERLGEVKERKARQTLVRVPIVADQVAGDAGTHYSLGGVGAAVLRPTADGEGLRQRLADDVHLRPFIEAAGGGIPAKDNGLDIEGLAVCADGQILVGLRGPVVGGLAVIVSFAVTDRPDHPGTLRLARTGQTRWFTKHFVDLGGCGIRDLCRDGQDLLILSGPSVLLDGPSRVYRLVDGAAQLAELTLKNDPRLQVLFDIDTSAGHPEGITMLPSNEVLVVFDSPTAERLNNSIVTADVHRLSLDPHVP